MLAWGCPCCTCELRTDLVDVETVFLLLEAAAAVEAAVEAAEAKAQVVAAAAMVVPVAQARHPSGSSGLATRCRARR
jgi:hypothetical protein